MTCTLALQIFNGDDQTGAYGGPAFDELDNSLQNALYDYLAVRPISILLPHA
jgi:hypothetical protein